MSRIVVLVSNDLEFDQRVAKVCDWLHSNGFEVTLVGRILPTSRPFHRPYRVLRFILHVYRGPLFYASLNLRLFYFLLFHRTDIILANDLDTLLPAWLVARLRGKHLVYDSHEYFTEAEGLTNRPIPKKVWTAIERRIFPRLKRVYTVNESIARIYRNQYGVPVEVVRNIPPLRPDTKLKSKEELGIPKDRSILILQGAFIDPDRGGLEIVEAMQYLPGCHLLVIGSGRDLNAMKAVAIHPEIAPRVTFFPRMPYEELRHYTAQADIGLSLDKPVHLNYLYSLPNKIFDYIHAGVPVLVSDLPELRSLVEKWKIGKVLPEVQPQSIAEMVDQMLNSPDYAQWKINASSAAKELNWQHESGVLKKIFGPLSDQSGDPVI